MNEKHRFIILDLVACAKDYGHNNDVVMCGFAELLESLSDEEIETHAKSLLKDGGYGEEDYEEMKENLIEFRDEYLPLKPQND